MSPDLIANYDHMTLTSPPISVKRQIYTLGAGVGSAGFVFDNEAGVQRIELDDFDIDAQAVTWAQYLPFAQTTGRALPRYLRRAQLGNEHAGNEHAGYEHLVFGTWQSLDESTAAVHLTWQEAHDWCAYHGRVLPSEAQWECAARGAPDFAWGQVWEWTRSDFTPFEGFAAHPYVDYSQPWFNTRKVLRGACKATLPIMRYAQYRNYFTADRSDIYAGFRSCSA